MRPREIFMHRTVTGWVIYGGRHCRRAKIFYLPQWGIEPRSLDLQANTLPRRCKNRLLPQGSRSVSYFSQLSQPNTSCSNFFKYSSSFSSSSCFFLKVKDQLCSFDNLTEFHTSEALSFNSFSFFSNSFSKCILICSSLC